METVKLFNSELSSLYETRPPISKAKMTSITRTAIKAIKFYKHVVQSVEKFIQKCKPEYKVPGLYVIDSIVRQSRHQFTAEKDVFAPRFARNIQNTFIHLFNCPHDDKGKIVRVLNLWQKNQVFTPEVIQPLLDMASLANKDQLVASNGVQLKTPPNPSIQPRNLIESKPSPVKDQPWMPVDANNSSTPQPVTAPTVNKVPGSSGTFDPNIIQQLQSLQNLITDSNNQQVKDKKDDTVKFDKKLLDFDYGEEEDEETSSPQPPTQPQQPLPSIDSLTSILSNPEVLRQLQTLQQQMASRQQQQDMEDKMRRLQEMRHQEEEFDKHLAQTVPKLPFASECDFKPVAGPGGGTAVAGDCLALQHILQPTQSQPPQPVAPPQCIQPPSGPPPGADFGSHPFRNASVEESDRPVDYDERANRQMSQQRMGTQDNGNVVEIIDLRMESPGRDSPPRRRRRSRSRSRGRARSRSRSRRRRSRSNDRDRDRDYDWDNRKQREVEREKERERRRKGLPTLKKNHLAVCSTTLWIGHLSKLVQQEELSDTFGEYGDIVSINLIPPRGCAFVCMNRRQDAARALQQLKHYKLQGKAITIAWAPGKGMKDREWKDYWEVEQGVSYIPWIKLSPDTDFELLEDGGMLDEESYPDWLKEKMNTKREKDRQEANNVGGNGGIVQDKIEENSAGNLNQLPPELDIPMPNPPTLPGFIPIPETPTPVSQANMPPPMSIIPPFALPPSFADNVGLMGPMGMPGPIGPPGLLGNVPLGVPPPLMMPQQMVPRMPASPFNPPLILGSGGGAAAGQQDKGKASLPQLGVPPPNTADTFPDHLASMVNPFGIPVPLSGMNSGLLGQNKGPAEMDVDDLNDTESPIKDPNLTSTTQGLSLMSSMVGTGFGHGGTPFGGLPLVQLPQQPVNISQITTNFNQTNNTNSSVEKVDFENKIQNSIEKTKSGEKESNNVKEKSDKSDNSRVGDVDMRTEQIEELDDALRKKRRESPVEDRRGGRRRDWGKPRINRWGDELSSADRIDRQRGSPIVENSARMHKEVADRPHLINLPPIPPEHHYQVPPNRNLIGGSLMGHYSGPNGGGNCGFGPVDRDDRGVDDRDDILSFPPPLLNTPRGGHGFFPRGASGMPPRSSPRPLLRTPNGPMFGPRGHPPGPGMMGLRGLRPGNRMEGIGFSMRGFPPPNARGRGARFSTPPPLQRDRRWEEPRPRWSGGVEEERKSSRWSTPNDDHKHEVKTASSNSNGGLGTSEAHKEKAEEIIPPGEEPPVTLNELNDSFKVTPDTTADTSTDKILETAANTDIPSSNTVTLAMPTTTANSSVPTSLPSTSTEGSNETVAVSSNSEQLSKEETSH